MEKSTLTKSVLQDEVHKLNPWRKRSYYNKWTKEELLSIYNTALKLGKIKSRPNLKIMRRGHDTKGYMIVNDMDIISRHNTKQGAEKALNKLLK